METKKIKTLITAIEKGSLSAASETLHYTPSAISRSIEALELELGLLLLTRSKGGVEPTNACRILLPSLKQIVLDEQLLLEHALQLSGKNTGTIRLGLSYKALYPWLSCQMASFKKMNPAITYMISNGYSSVLLDQVRSREIDFCIISKRETKFNWIPLLTDDLVAILPPGHPLAAMDSVPITFYNDASFLNVHSYKETDNANALNEYGINPKNIVQLEDNFAMYALAGAGLGIGMDNRINTLDHLENTVIKPIDPPQIIEIGIVYGDHVLPVVKEFLIHLEQSKIALQKMIAEQQS
ncbi:MAG: LysR family transcriptional regulator [Lachnospiraceae bacterium]|nr:LysR family transcriptional regulator [Lachnospiraceae bacterium]